MEERRVPPIVLRRTRTGFEPASRNLPEAIPNVQRRGTDRVGQRTLGLLTTNTGENLDQIIDDIVVSVQQLPHQFNHINLQKSVIAYTINSRK